MRINDKKKKGEGREIRENNHGQTDGQTYIGTGIEGGQSGKKKSRDGT